MSKIAVSDAAAYAKMLVSGIGSAGDTTAVDSINQSIDQLSSTAVAGASFDLDTQAEAVYQAAKKVAQDAIDAAD